jgi:hypothetical protein
VDSWADDASCGSFRAVALVAIWGLGLLLREALVTLTWSVACVCSLGGRPGGTASFSVTRPDMRGRLGGGLVVGVV